MVGELVSQCWNPEYLCRPKAAKVLAKLQAIHNEMNGPNGIGDSADIAAAVAEVRREVPAIVAIETFPSVTERAISTPADLCSLDIHRGEMAGPVGNQESLYFDQEPLYSDAWGIRSTMQSPVSRRIEVQL